MSTKLAGVRLKRKEKNKKRRKTCAPLRPGYQLFPTGVITRHSLTLRPRRLLTLINGINIGDGICDHLSSPDRTSARISSPVYLPTVDISSGVFLQSARYSYPPPWFSSRLLLVHGVRVKSLIFLSGTQTLTLSPPPCLRLLHRRQH